MDFKSKKSWIEPEVQSYGSSGDQGSNQRPAMFGQNCGETVIRYGAPCGIRTGQACLPRIGTACLPRIGHECLPRIGPSCMARVGAPCSARIGTECSSIPGEPSPPQK